jgi:diphosphomevalonate decarboxylase
MSYEVELNVKYRSSPNIAWIKYWGKYNEEYILPLNDSLGLTLNQNDINTETSIIFSKKVEKDILILNL